MGHRPSHSPPWRSRRSCRSASCQGNTEPGGGGCSPWRRWTTNPISSISEISKHFPWDSTTASATVSRTASPYLRALSRETFRSADPQIGKFPTSAASRCCAGLREDLAGTRAGAVSKNDRNTEADVIEGLLAGADDFMIKPMRVGGLTARVKALLRRAYRRRPAGTRCRSAATASSVAGAQITVDGQPVTLKQKEFDLALFLLREHRPAALAQAPARGGVGDRGGGVVALARHPRSRGLRTKLGLRPPRTATGSRRSSASATGWRRSGPGGSGGASGTGHRAGRRGGSSRVHRNARRRSEPRERRGRREVGGRAPRRFATVAGGSPDLRPRPGSRGRAPAMESTVLTWRAPSGWSAPLPADLDSANALVLVFGPAALDGAGARSVNCAASSPARCWPAPPATP